MEVGHFGGEIGSERLRAEVVHIGKEWESGKGRL